jgi:hypothetical protein
MRSLCFPDPRACASCRRAGRRISSTAWGLGDVYEISDAPRITSMTPLSGDPAGGTNVSIYGTGFSPTSTA